MYGKEKTTIYRFIRLNDVFDTQLVQHVFDRLRYGKMKKPPFRILENWMTRKTLNCKSGLSPCRKCTHCPRKKLMNIENGLTTA